MTKLISLTKGQFAIVDDADFEWLSQWKWRYIPRSKHAAVGNAGREVGNTTVYMHRVIVDAPMGSEVDHINHNSLDNQRLNLRITNHAGNLKNRAKYAKAASQFKGVTWHDQAQKWRAKIGVNGKRISLGLFDNELDAAIAYDRAAIIHHGEYASLNVPPPEGTSE